jgi:hypothetical protein
MQGVPSRHHCDLRFESLGSHDHTRPLAAHGPHRINNRRDFDVIVSGTTDACNPDILAIQVVLESLLGIRGFHPPELFLLCNLTCLFLIQGKAGFSALALTSRAS